jgi:hypothetical protein
MTASFKTTIFSTVLVLASASTVSSLAQTPATPTTPAAASQGARTPGKGLKALDTNHDNMLSRDEVKSRPKLTKNFDAMDSNKDGQLSRDEIKAYRKAHKGEGKKPA